jgi:L-alanine-DL-glutamate epimerase-like enolase superfamily enzyme
MAGSYAAFIGIGQALAQSISTKIKDVQTMTIVGGRTYVFVKVTTDDGHFGVGEAYGSPGVGVAEQIQALRKSLIGKNPLEIDKLYTSMGGGAGLEGSRTDGSAHNLMRAVSGVEMALWDLAGKLLNTPTSVLLGGQFRQYVRVYDHSRPRDMFDKASCREWAAKVRAHPSGFTAHKIDIPRTQDIWQPPRNPDANRAQVAPSFSPAEGMASNIDNARDPSNRQLTTKELMRIAQAYENVREAIGWEHDIMVHCHWEFDLASSLQLAEAVAPMKPLWLEDPLGVDYSDSWKRLAERSPVPILTGENLTRREGFAPFIVNQGCDIVNPDLRNSGGFLESKRIADLAAIYGLPMTVHNTGSQLYTYQACQWAASIRDFLACETVTGEGGWMDQVLRLDDPYIQKGYIKVSDRPGTGADLNREVVEAHLAPGEKWWGDS